MKSEKRAIRIIFWIGACMQILLLVTYIYYCSYCTHLQVRCASLNALYKEYQEQCKDLEASLALQMKPEVIKEYAVNVGMKPYAREQLIFLKSS